MKLDLVTIESSPIADILRRPAATVEFPLSAEIKALIAAMKLKLIEIEGAGLAAPQVGYHVRVIVYHVTPLDLEIRNDVEALVPMTVLINPSYMPLEAEGKVADWEGCFSVESIRGKPSRYKAIAYQGYTPSGEKVEGIARGHLARLLQHEIDHIRGILFIDVLTPNCIQGSAAEMMAIRHQELEEKAKAKNDSTALQQLKEIEERRRKK